MELQDSRQDAIATRRAGVYKEARRIAIDRWELVRRVQERKRRVLGSRLSIATGGEIDGKLQRRAVVEEMKDQGLVEFRTEDGGETRTSMWASAAAECAN